MMRVLDLGVLYMIIGVGCVIVLWYRASERPSGLSSLLILVLWPVYAPYELAGSGDGPRSTTPGPDGAFLETMLRIEGTPLEGLLPDQATAHQIAARLRAAQQRVEDIDRTLTGEGFNRDAAVARLEELEAKGDEVSTGAARRRLQNIDQLRALRVNATQRLEQVGELLLQLKTQAEVLRLAGEVDDGTRELFEELMRRLDGMDELMRDMP